MTGGDDRLQIWKICQGEWPAMNIRSIAAITFMQSFITLAVIGQDANTDARAKEMLAQTRVALGGERALSAIQSLSASGDFRSGSEGKRTSGEVQLEMLLPDKLMRTMKWNATPEMKVTAVQAMNGGQVWMDSHEKAAGLEPGIAPVLGGGHGMGRRGGMGRGGGPGSGGSGSGGGHGGTHAPGPVPSSIGVLDPQQIRPDFSCLIYALLLHLPESVQVDINPAVSAAMEGTDADYLKITAGKDLIIDLAIDRKTHRPVMAAYTMPLANESGREEEQSAASESGLAQIQIYFSDYREISEKKIGNVWLPHQITKTQNGLTVEDMRITKYQLNSHISPKEFENKK
jgi:hypothetical protein